MYFEDLSACVETKDLKTNLESFPGKHQAMLVLDDIFPKPYHLTIPTPSNQQNPQFDRIHGTNVIFKIINHMCGKYMDVSENSGTPKSSHFN